jgi:hypothetical protein
MKYITASANRDLDEILDLIGISVQLDQTRFLKAEKSYEAVGNWLHDDDSPVAVFDPQVKEIGQRFLFAPVEPFRPYYTIEGAALTAG